jgi:glucose-1-phosphate cytidylyltransferase
MKAVILAGGLGTRISEETHLRPKPMIEIGGKPILWHIMKIYLENGIDDFIICCGYKGHIIKEYFYNYSILNSDVTFDMRNNQVVVHNKKSENWKVTLVDTGEHTMTGGRLKRVANFLEDDSFCFTYGDGVSNINIQDTIKFHKEHGKLATLTAVPPPSRFGILDIESQSSKVLSFIEKPKNEDMFVNAGFFVLNPKVIDFVDGDHVSWEKEPLSKIAINGELHAYKHDGFWMPMDTLRDKIVLEDLWQTQKAPWKIWKD